MNELQFKTYYRVVHAYNHEIIGTTARIYPTLEEAHEWAQECVGGMDGEGFCTFIEEVRLAESDFYRGRGK